MPTPIDIPLIGDTDVQHTDYSNLAQNPGFENEDVNSPSWSGDAQWSVVASNPQTGTYAAKCLPTVEAAIYTFNNLNLVDCRPGDRFYASAYFKGISVIGTTPRAGVRLRWLDVNKTLISTSDGNSVAPGSYTQSKGVLTAPANTVYAQVAVRVSGSSGGTWYADDVEFRRAILSDWVPVNSLNGDRLDSASSAALASLFLSDLLQIGLAGAPDGSIRLASLVSDFSIGVSNQGSGDSVLEIGYNYYQGNRIDPLDAAFHQTIESDYPLSGVHYMESNREIIAEDGTVRRVSYFQIRRDNAEQGLWLWAGDYWGFGETGSLEPGYAGQRMFLVSAVDGYGYLNGCFGVGITNPDFLSFPERRVVIPNETFYSALSQSGSSVVRMLGLNGSDEIIVGYEDSDSPPVRVPRRLLVGSKPLGTPEAGLIVYSPNNTTLEQTIIWGFNPDYQYSVDRDDTSGHCKFRGTQIGAVYYDFDGPIIPAVNNTLSLGASGREYGAAYIHYLVTSDFSFATHNHQSAAGGGLLSPAAISGLGALATKNTAATADIDNDAVSNAKAANMATQTLKGRNTAGTGDPEDLSASTVKTILGLGTGSTPQFTALGLGAANAGVSPLEVYSSASSSRLLFASTHANGVAGIQLRGTVASVASNWYIDNRGGNDAPNSRLAFINESTERLTILTSGYTGINTNNPGAALEIYNGASGDYLRIGVGAPYCYKIGRNSGTGYLDFDGTQSGFVGFNFISGVMQFGEGVHFVVGTSTGTKIGTATSQKLSLWNATPIVQPTTGVAAATFVANTGTAVNDASTFDGYTMKQVVKALRNIGALA
jgi:hypothetical protein